MTPWRALILMLGGFLLLFALASRQGAPEAAAALPNSAFMAEFLVPVPNSGPRNIAVEQVRKVWVTLQDANAIGRLTVTTPTHFLFEIFPLPTPNSAPYDLVLDDTYVWFTETGNNKIGRLEKATGTITEYAIPTANSEPRGIDIAPDGTLWFTESSANQFAQLNPATGVITETVYPTTGATLDDIAVVSNNSIWVTAANSNPSLHRVFEYRPATGTFINVPVANFNIAPFPPGKLALAPNGRPWLTAPTKDWVGLYAPGTLALWRWQNSASPGAEPLGIAYSERNGNVVIFYTESGINRVGRMELRPSGRRIYALDHPLPSVNSQPHGIDVDDEGTAWITAPGSNKVVSWSAPYLYFDYLPTTVR